jgi:hypothetical protein
MNDNQNINISQQNVAASCTSKCAYNFDYPESSLTAENHGYFISLSYDSGSTAPVTFNTKKYNVTAIYIFAPSVHLFNNQRAAGEFCIEHTPVAGGPNLTVCIPLTSSGNSSNLVSQIIQTTAQNSPNDGETTNLNISGFTLNNIVPSKPYYYYNESGNTDYIVYDISNAIQISNSIINSLKQIIKPYPISTTGSELFYNSAGPNTVSSNKLEEGIYISCQPTGNSTDTTNVSYAKPSTNFDMENIWKNPTFQIFIEVLGACSIFIILFFAINFAYTKYISGGGGSPIATLTKNISKVVPASIRPKPSST